jgi:copper oxidase (laccase) domain-containing protein
VALLAPGAVGIAHAGWRGLVGGVVERTVEALCALGGLGAGELEALVGPCIGPESYEFGEAELAEVAGRYGDGVRATTAGGRPALDLAAGVESALRGAGVARVQRVGGCTASDPSRWFSHRARADAGRQGSFVWLDGDGPSPATTTLR